MNLLMVTASYPPAKGGMQVQAFEVAKGIFEAGENVTVLTPHFDGDREFDQAQGFETVRSGSFKRLSAVVFPLFFSALRLVFRKRIEKVLCESWIPSGVVGFAAAKVFGLDFFVVAHGSDVLESRRNPWLKKAMCFIFGQARKIFAVSNFTKKAIVECGIPAEKVQVIFNGVDPSKFSFGGNPLAVREKHGLKGKKVMLTVSRLVERKGHDMVIKAMPLILKEVPEAVYLIVGEGPERERLEQLVREMNLEDKVVFAGGLPADDGMKTLAEYYKAGDVFVMPNRIVDGDVEGFGIAFLEAGACGKPVIGGRSGGVPDAVLEGKTGLLVDPEDHRKLAAAVTRLLSDRKLAEELGRNGRERMEKELNWRALSQKYYRVICDA